MIKLTLVMTEEEATLLKEITGRIGGYPDGPRGFTDRVGDALGGVGVEWIRNNYIADGNIRLVNNWKNHSSRIECKRLD